MAKLTLSDHTNLNNSVSTVGKLNSNNTLVENAIENTLSRDGTSPNSMQASLDMDSHKILNLPEPGTGHEPATKQYVDTVLTEAALGSVSNFYLASGTVEPDSGIFETALSQTNPIYSDISLISVDSAPATPTIVKLPLSKLMSTKSLLQMGAVGDGSTAENMTTVNSAIATAFAAGTRVFDGLDKTYKMTGSTGLILPTGAKIKNFELEASGMSNNTQIIYIGGSLATDHSLTSDSLVNTKTVLIADTSGFSENDLVYIDSNKSFFSTSEIGELNRIREVVSGTELTLDDAVSFSYTTADAAKIKKVTASRNMTTVRDGRIYGGNGTVTNQWGLLAQYCDYVTFDNIETHNIGYSHIGSLRTFSPYINNCRMRRAEDAGLAYGIHLGNGTRNARVSKGSSGWMRHGVTIGIGGAGGVTIDTEVEGFHAHHCRDAGIDGHPAYLGYKISNCSISGDSGAYSAFSSNDGMTLQGVNTVVENCNVSNFVGTGIFAQQILTTGPYFKGGHVKILNNHIENISGNGIDVIMNSSGTGEHTVIITGNTIMNTGGAESTTSPGTYPYSAIRVYTATGTTITNAIIDKNITDGCSGSGSADILIDVRASSTLKRLSILNNHLRDSNGRGVYIKALGTIQNVEVVGGSIFDVAGGDGCCFVYADSGGIINRVLIKDIHMDTAIMGAYVRAFGATSVISSLNIQGLYCRNISSSNVYALADSSGVITLSRFSMNDIDGGSYGIRMNGLLTAMTDGTNSIVNSTSKRDITSVTNLSLGRDLNVTLTMSATIATGVLSTTALHDGNLCIKADTQGAAATDDLDTLTIAGISNHQTVVVCATSSARDIVMKDGTGNMKLAGDCTLDNVEDTITLQYNSVDGYYREIARSNNGT